MPSLWRAPQNSQAYSTNGRSRRARAMNRAAVSMLRERDKIEKTKPFKKRGKQKVGKGHKGNYFWVRFSVTFAGARNEEASFSNTIP